MVKRYYLGLDQGTTSTTALMLDAKWNVAGKGNLSHKQYYPKPGWVEHDPMEIWNVIVKATQEAIKDANVSADEIACIGLANQGETVVVWDKLTGDPIYNAIVWQDRRTSRYATSLSLEE